MKTVISATKIPYPRLVFLCILLQGTPVLAQESEPVPLPGEQGNEPDQVGDNAESVSYPAAFFQSYNPVNVRDMVLQVPGFQIDEGGDARGFGGAAGNILLNGERPSTKSDDAGEILSRIPADQVLRIDLIRGDTGGLNLRGQSVVVNVVLQEDAVASTRWEATVRTTANTATLNPEVNVSRTGRWGRTQYTIGLETGEDRFHQQRGTEWLLVEEGVAEERTETADDQERGYSANLNTETQLNESVLHFNARIETEEIDDFEESLRQARLPGYTSSTVLESDNRTEDALELGTDVGFPLTEQFVAKIIGLFNRVDRSGESSLRTRDAAGGVVALSEAFRDSESEEIITRIELDWSGWAGHQLEGNVEGTLNTLDSALTLFEDEGEGREEVSVPVGNTRIEEVRWDVELVDTWDWGAVTVESALAAEYSTLTQSGETGRDRSFSFLKPRLLLTYAPQSQRQYRIRLQREVAQLDFNDFASSTNFGDRQLDLGNPELKPENTWEAQFTFEQRFGELGVTNVSLFHHWINDVQDTLPLSGVLEVPGNIGDGRRWGVETEMTFALDSLGIIGGRVDISGRWQDSEVKDPVTGRSRILSEEVKHQAEMNFRQNLPALSMAWGGKLAVVSGVPVFGLDEYVLTDDIAETLDMDLFIETTRWFGLRTQLRLGNILDRTFHRDRRVFTGARELTPSAFRELRNRTRGSSIEVSVTGNF